MFGYMFGVLFSPETTWPKIASLPDAQIKRLLPFPIIMALLPAVAFYVGTTEFGWTVLGNDVTRMTHASAIPLAVLFYFALLGAVVGIGSMIHWMSATYEGSSFPIKGVVLMGYACSPIFLAGLLGIYPVWWFDILLATGACGYAIRLFYLGISPMMKVPEDRGFLYASAVFLVSLVYVVLVLVGTTIIWEYVATPVFTD